MEKSNSSPLRNFCIDAEAFQAKIKIGIYKELYKKGLITKKQLDALIKLQNIGANFTNGV